MNHLNTDTLYPWSNLACHESCKFQSSPGWNRYLASMQEIQNYHAIDSMEFTIMDYETCLNNYTPYCPDHEYNKDCKTDQGEFLDRMEDLSDEFCSLCM